MKTAAALWREQWAWCHERFTEAQIAAAVLRRMDDHMSARYAAASARRFHLEAIYAQECHWACVVDDPGANDPTF